jgi:DNA polymerase, archaea type
MLNLTRQTHHNFKNIHTFLYPKRKTTPTKKTMTHKQKPKQSSKTQNYTQNIYPIDVAIENGKIKLYTLVQDSQTQNYTHEIFFIEFENYFYATQKIAHDSITNVTSETKLFFGTVYKHITTQKTNLREITQGHAVYHHDVPFTQKFMIDTKLKFFTKTIISYIIREDKINHNTNDRTNENKEHNDHTKIIQTITTTDEIIDFTKLTILGFDIETYAKTKEINSHNNPIISIATVAFNSHTNTHQKYVFTHTIKSKLKETIIAESEKDMLLKVAEHIKTLKPHIIVGYNSDAFDFSYIHDRCEHHKIVFDCGYDAPLKFKSGQTPVAFTPGFCHIDLLTYVRMHLRTQLETNSYSLNNVAKELLGNQKDEVDISKLHIAWDTQNTEKLDTYFKYNIQDAQLCVELFIKLQENILEFGRMIYAPIQEITRMSYSQLVENYLMGHVNDYNTLIPPKPTNEEVQERLLSPKNIGAFVFKPTPGFYEHIIVCDYRSLYPSIIASLNIDRGVMSKTPIPNTEPVPEYPTPLYFDKNKESFIPKLTEQIIIRRDEIKNGLKTAEKEDIPLLKARIYNLKILANSLYGYLSFARARWYCSECGGATTAYARYFIKQTINAATKEGFTVIYSDTDSIFLELKKKTTEQALAFVKTFNTKLPGIMELQFEDEFETGIFVSAKGKEGGAKKRYALYDADKDHFKIAGLEYVRTDWSPLARHTQYKVLELLLKEQKPKAALEYVKTIIQNIRTKKIPFDDFILSSKLSRDVDDYQTNSPHVTIAKKLIKMGESVNTRTNLKFVIAQGKGALYEKARLPQEVSLNDLDEDYYIENQVIPATISLLSLFNYTKEDLLTKHSQNSLDSFFG